MCQDDLERKWPGLKRGEYDVTSPETIRYNCIAWAAGDDRRWWQPIEVPYSYWPEDAPNELTCEAFEAAFATLGYERSESAGHEPELEKVAIFVDDGGDPTHMARQLPTGEWTSKLGDLHDVRHRLEALEGSRYGRVHIILQRPRH